MIFASVCTCIVHVHFRLATHRHQNGVRMVIWSILLSWWFSRKALVHFNSFMHYNNAQSTYFHPVYVCGAKDNVYQTDEPLPLQRR